MASLNKVMVIGNLGRDPEARMAGESKVVSFSIAVTERFKGRDGQQKETTEWVNIVVWNRLAEIAEQYLRKGSPVFIEGKLKTRSWDDSNGVKKYMTEVVGSSLQMLGSKQAESGQAGPKVSQQQQQQAPAQGFAPEESDLPF